MAVAADVEGLTLLTRSSLVNADWQIPRFTDENDNGKGGRLNREFLPPRLLVLGFETHHDITTTKLQ